MALKNRGSSKAAPDNILRVLKAHPEGLPLSVLRRLCDAVEDEQFGRRVRQIRDLGWDYTTKKISGTNEHLYVLTGPRGAAPDKGVTEKLRAAVLHEAHGQCQMCGLNITQDGVKLQVDHRIPRSWGGQSTLENLWAICEKCNRGKKAFFENFNDGEMKDILSHNSTYERISRTLKLHFGEPVASDYLSFVANFEDYQEDWQKRLRELRYPVIGMEIKSIRKKEGRRMRPYYKMTRWAELPPDHARLIKEYERNIRSKSGL